jgi:Uroporphyrinogen decarboxylase (URO-D)
MNERQRFSATMHYLPRDRSPLMDFSFWEETIQFWHEQGLPAFVTRNQTDTYFGMDSGIETIYSASGVNVTLEPYFEEIVLEDKGENEVVQQIDGVRVLRSKFMGSIPSHIGHLLTDRQSWEKYYKPRLDPKSPARYPAAWEKYAAYWNDPNREVPIALPGGSLFGVLRDWMGLKNVSYLMYDNPVLFEEMIATLTHCTIEVLKKTLSSNAKFEACAFWEDMAYKNGPLISPKSFRKFLLPYYKKITDLVYKHGVDIVFVDCDGDIDLLVPLWLEAGINCLFPVEIGTWHADPVAIRKKYGKELRMMGGFNKTILKRSKKEIEREIIRLTPLIEEGGYISFCDHRVPPDVPFENYLFYLKTIRKIWGKDTNLKPMSIFPGTVPKNEMRLSYLRPGG